MAADAARQLQSAADNQSPLPVVEDRCLVAAALLAAHVSAPLADAPAALLGLLATVPLSRCGPRPPPNAPQLPAPLARACSLSPSTPSYRSQKRTGGAASRRT